MVQHHKSKSRFLQTLLLLSVLFQGFCFFKTHSGRLTNAIVKKSRVGTLCSGLKPSSICSAGRLASRATAQREEVFHRLVFVPNAVTSSLYHGLICQNNEAVVRREGLR